MRSADALLTASELDPALSVRMPSALHDAILRSLPTALIGPVPHLQAASNRLSLDSRSTSSVPPAAGDGRFVPSLTADPTTGFLYLLTPSALHKIGSGYRDTSAGKVYLSRKEWGSGGLHSVGWVVWAHGKLYLRRAASSAVSSPPLFEVLSPDTLTSVGQIQQNGRGSIATTDHSK